MFHSPSEHYSRVGKTSDLSICIRNRQTDNFWTFFDANGTLTPKASLTNKLSVWLVRLKWTWVRCFQAGGVNQTIFTIESIKHNWTQSNNCHLIIKRNRTSKIGVMFDHVWFFMILTITNTSLGIECFGLSLTMWCVTVCESLKWNLDSLN